MGGQGREGLGRRAFAIVSLRGFQQVKSKPGRLWLPGQETRRASGVELSPPELGHKSG